MAFLDDNTQTKPPNKSFVSDTLMILDEFLNTQNTVTLLMGEVENKTKVTKRVQFLASVSFLFFYLALGQAAGFLCNVIVLAFPCYASVRSIEAAKNSADEVKLWLMYWIVFSSVSFVEVFVSWVPTYRILKVLLLLWCMAPGKPNGAYVIYHYLIRPFAMKHRDTVDTAISEVAKTVRRSAEKAAEYYRPERKTDLQTKLLFAIKQVGRLRGFSDEDADVDSGSKVTVTKKME